MTGEDTWSSKRVTFPIWPFVRRDAVRWSLQKKRTKASFLFFYFAYFLKFYFKLEVNGRTVDMGIIPLKKETNQRWWLVSKTNGYFCRLYASLFFVYNLPYDQNHRWIRREMYTLVYRDCVVDLNSSIRNKNRKENPIPIEKIMLYKQNMRIWSTFFSRASIVCMCVQCEEEEEEKSN